MSCYVSISDSATLYIMCQFRSLKNKNIVIESSVWYNNEQLTCGSAIA